jgi:predicted GIY-YIG superfamily endonuclease
MTIRHILEVLGKPHRFLGQMHELLQYLFDESDDHTTSPSPGHQLLSSGQAHLSQVSFFRPCDAIIGQTKCVYLLVSTRDTSFSYIGQTENMGRRLVQHNSGNGATVTSNPVLMPWAVMAYVVGFQFKHERLKFEALWKITALRRKARSMDELTHVASDLIADYNTSCGNTCLFKLRLVFCGTIVAQLHNTC